MFDVLENARQEVFRAWNLLSKSDAFQKRISHELSIRLDSNVCQLSASLHLIAPQYTSTRQRAASTDCFPQSPEGLEQLQLLHHEALKLAVLFNAFYFSLRGLQDNLYCGLLELKRQNWHDGSSMAKVFSNPNSEYAPALKEALPEYEAWFSSMRELRNSMKSGGPSSGGSFDPESGCFRLSYVVKPQGKKFLLESKGITVGIDELVEALMHSAQLIRYLGDAANGA